MAGRVLDLRIEGVIPAWIVTIMLATVAKVVTAINPADPGWAHLLVLAMGCDVVLLNFAYAGCFVMALRGNPLFPRALVATWLIDIAMQLAIAQVMGGSGLPDGLIDPLGSLLRGNCLKVLISILLWLPYLILSPQVNLVFRHRVPERTRPIAPAD